MEGLGDEKRHLLAQDLAEHEVALSLLCEEVIEEEEERVDMELEAGLAAAMAALAREVEDEEGVWWSGSEEEEDVEEEMSAPAPTSGWIIHMMEMIWCAWIWTTTSCML
jgi:hypothetical protein